MTEICILGSQKTQLTTKLALTQKAFLFMNEQWGKKCGISPVINPMLKAYIISSSQNAMYIPESFVSTE